MSNWFKHASCAAPAAALAVVLQRVEARVIVPFAGTMAAGGPGDDLGTRDSRDHGFSFLHLVQTAITSVLNPV